MIHHLPWKKGDSNNAIAESYADFTMGHYGLARVVFDGYGEGPSIKTLHTKYLFNFTAETEFSSKKGLFVSCQKQDRYTCSHQCSTQSPGDADVDIVKATVERSHHCTTALVGEDTDFLILLLYYPITGNEIIYFHSDANKQFKVRKVHTINLLKETL